jgi:glycyl-tRNA synthetase beta chain
MVRELTELQGTMGGIYAREEGLPEQIWKAIYFHYLPIGVETDAPPTRQQLGSAAVTWAAVSLADKLDSVVGMFTAGERPTGSRDPLGLRRQAQGAVKILADLPELTGIQKPLILTALINKAAQPFGGLGEAQEPVHRFMAERVAYLFEARGYDVRTVRAVNGGSPLTSRWTIEALASMSGSSALLEVGRLLKRAKNITKGVGENTLVDGMEELLREPSERALLTELQAAGPVILAATENHDYRAAFGRIAQLQPVVAKFFDDVLVMAEDQNLRMARLALVASLRNMILRIADISEMVTGD